MSNFLRILISESTRFRKFAHFREISQRILSIWKFAKKVTGLNGKPELKSILALQDLNLYQNCDFK